MDSGDSFLVGAMGATIKAATGFNAMPNYFATAMIAFRGKGMNGAFETVEVMGDSIGDDFEGLIVIVAANFTGMHGFRPGLPGCWSWMFSVTHKKLSLKSHSKRRRTAAME
jgi:hypothetical protein